ncbi:BMP family lipoprotein [Streptomyces sp. TP-A0874]|uniref:BMP family lipoprotein n=1 Tax=Streptomyces sp. TP-A0874 TaxID=549819 RepID=UPI0008529462|nr:BMP family ABC transporter substrate-binding protein [Streptomyces sp. TP-A0874]
MRRVSKITVAALAAAALASTTAACGASSTDSDSKGSDGLKVGVAYDVGGRGDHSFNDSAARGLDQAKDELGAEVKELTATTSDTEADRVDKLTQLAEAGYNPVIGVGFAYQPSLAKVAKKFPDVNFAIVDSTVDAKNVAGLVFAEQEVSYLAGVAAAHKSKSGDIGFIGGTDNPLILKFQAGFEKGVADTDPKAKVTSEFLAEDEAGFGMPDKGLQTAQGMLARGTDVIYHAAGGSGSGVIEAVGKAKNKNAWAIGVDSDQAIDPGLADYKDRILTSAMKNVDVAVFDMVKSVKDGKPITGTRSFSLAEDGVKLATTGDHLKDIQADIDAAREKIANGEIKVPTTPAK